MAGEQGLVPHRKRVPEGTTLMKEGDTGDGFYILEHGKLDVRVNKKRVAVIEATEGAEFVGEVAALLNSPRTATVIAASECTVLYLRITDIERVLAAAPSLGVKLARSLAKKLVNASRRKKAA